MNFIIKDIEELRKEDHPMPPKFFLNYWHRGEISILGGDPNVGKSFLINDLCVGIYRGISFWGEPITEVRGRCFVVDLEMSDSMFGNRIKGAPEGLFYGITRISISLDNGDLDLSVEKLTAKLVEILKNYDGDKCVFIDNLTDLIGRRSKEKTAIELINRLRPLAERYNTSFLLVAHTIKRNPGKPITTNDICGSKAIIDAVDSVFVICESIKGEGICYVKHLKARFTSRYKEVAELELIEQPYLHFSLRDWNYEAEHLPARRDRARKYSESEIIEVVRLHTDGFSTREIQDKTGVSKSTVARIIKEYNSL